MKYILLGLLSISFNLQAVDQTCRSETEFPSSTPSEDFEINNNGTVVHQASGLMWQQCAHGFDGADCSNGNVITLNWSEALELAEASNFAGYNDWRLPNLKELFTIVEQRCKYPSMSLTVFPFIYSNNSPYRFFWTSTPDLSSDNYARAIDFSFGQAVSPWRNNLNRVRLVRDNK